jgi:hypothetical protein
VRPGEEGYEKGVAIALLHVDTQIQGCRTSNTLLYQYPLPLLLHVKERQTITLASVFVKKKRNLIIKGGLEAWK